jgi:hypothetical protein
VLFEECEQKVRKTVRKNVRKKYRASIMYGGGTNDYLGTFDTKEHAGIAYDRFVVDKSTDEVSFTLNVQHGLPTSGTNKEQYRRYLY